MQSNDICDYCQHYINGVFTCHAQSIECVGDGPTGFKGKELKESEK